jgi:hypothetical protein
MPSSLAPLSGCCLGFPRRPTLSQRICDFNGLERGAGFPPATAVGAIGLGLLILQQQDRERHHRQLASEGPAAGAP